MAKLILLALIAVIAYRWWNGGTKRAAPMTPADARALLGLGAEAGLADIREAHRRLIARVHPDTGGSTGLANRVNAARDALIAELNRRASRAS